MLVSSNFFRSTYPTAAQNVSLRKTRRKSGGERAEFCSQPPARHSTSARLTASASSLVTATCATQNSLDTTLANDNNNCSTAAVHISVIRWQETAKDGARKCRRWLSARHCQGRHPSPAAPAAGGGGGEGCVAGGAGVVRLEPGGVPAPRRGAAPAVAGGALRTPWAPAVWGCRRVLMTFLLPSETGLDR